MAFTHLSRLIQTYLQIEVSASNMVEFSNAYWVALVLCFTFKVEPYPIPGSFLKLKYLKTELNVDNGTNAIV